MSYENCFDCPFFKSKPERCISKDLEKECKEYKKNDRKDTLFVYVCDKCGESLDVQIESEFAKISFEGTWSCKCGEVIRIKWDGKELKYL